MRNNLFTKTLTATTIVLAAATVCIAQDTKPKAAQSDRETQVKHHVWTNDDIASLRSPADAYQFEKEARDAAEASAKQRAEMDLAQQASLATKQPATLEETERAIKDSLEDIQDQKDTLARLNKELDESPQDQKAEKAKEIDRRTAVLQASENELKGFQDRRSELARTASAGRTDASQGATSASAAASCDQLSPSCPN